MAAPFTNSKLPSAVVMDTGFGIRAAFVRSEPRDGYAVAKVRTRISRFNFQMERGIAVFI
jgi:hypothetical protein